MAISTAMLGINARNYQYIRRYNRRKYKLIADDKLLTKERLLAANVPTNALLARFTTLDDVRKFNWRSLPSDFAVKPARGYGGRGITVVRDWNGDNGRSGGRPITRFDLENAIFGALDGEHSLKNLPDVVLVEDRIRTHGFFKKYISKGVPDIRVIVFNKVPVMAMMRLPTIASDGKANLHYGALGVGIDIRTGITTYGVVNNKLAKYIPDTKIKVRGIKLPNWDEVLGVSVAAQVTSGLGFAGIDIVLDDRQGPLVLEVNARPGLSIQVANQASLRTRLERIAELEVKTEVRGVDLGKKLFAETALEDVVEAEQNMLSLIEKITIIGDKGRKTVRAKVDTGAFRTSLDSGLVEELGLDPHPELIRVRSGSGRQRRRAVQVTYRMKGREINTVASYTPRDHLRFPVIIGRKDMDGFLVDPNSNPEGVFVK